MVDGLRVDDGLIVDPWLFGFLIIIGLHCPHLPSPPPSLAEGLGMGQVQDGQDGSHKEDVLVECTPCTALHISGC